MNQLLKFINPIKNSILDSILGEEEDFEYIGSTTPNMLSAELGRFIDDYRRGVMPGNQVTQRLDLLDRLRVAQTVTQRDRIIEELRRACS